jgi:hypothetical protein
VSSEHKIRTAALKLPASSFLEMAAASFVSCNEQLSDILTGGGFGGVGCSPLHAPARLLTMLARFLVAPPLSGTASIAEPNDKNESHVAKSFGYLEILDNSLASVEAHSTRAALGILVINLVHGG